MFYPRSKVQNAEAEPPSQNSRCLQTPDLPSMFLRYSGGSPGVEGGGGGGGGCGTNTTTDPTAPATASGDSSQKSSSGDPSSNDVEMKGL